VATGALPEATAGYRLPSPSQLASSLPRRRRRITVAVVTPPAPALSHWPWEEADRTVTYRNYLLTLKWELVTKGMRDSPLVRTIDALFAQDTITQDPVQALITAVRNAVPGQPRAAEQPDVLRRDEIGAFDDAVEQALQLIDGALSSSTAIRDGFGPAAETDTKARKNFDNIKAQLLRWKNSRATRVRINRTPGAYFVAYALVGNDDSTLMLGAQFFQESPVKTAGTLIHEASHGCLGTTDVAYDDAPYFVLLRDQVALGNADNYRYAAELGAGRQPLAAAVQAPRTPLQEYEQALSLCAYKAAKVAPVVVYLYDKYRGEVRHVHKDTREEHERLMHSGRTRRGRPGGRPLPSATTNGRRPRRRSRRSRSNGHACCRRS
jgi:hypothetical protein